MFTPQRDDTGRQTDRQTDRQRQRDRDRETDTEREGEREPDMINVRDPRKHLTLVNNNSQETILNVAKFLVCAFNIRSSKLGERQTGRQRQRETSGSSSMLLYVHRDRTDY